MKRRAPKLQDVEAVLESDRRFFERFPERRHRVRVASQGEIANLRLASGGKLQAPRGCECLAAVRHVAPGVRARVFLYATAGAPTDLPENVAASIFHNVLHGTGAVLDEKGREPPREYVDQRLSDLAHDADYYPDADPADICPRLDYPDEGDTSW